MVKSLSTGAHGKIKSMSKSRSGPGGMGLRRQVKEGEMMWTSVLNFHTLQATGNSIRPAENLVTSGILELRPVRSHALLREFGEGGQRRIEAGPFNQTVPGKQTQEVTQIPVPSTRSCLHLHRGDKSNWRPSSVIMLFLITFCCDGRWERDVQR